MPTDLRRGPSSIPTEVGLIAHRRQSLAAWKVPNWYSFSDELPTSEVGKILRLELRWARLAWVPHVSAMEFQANRTDRAELPA